MAAKLICFLLLLTVAGGSFSQKSKKFKKAPPGTVQVNDTLFVDKTEVANVHWREYIFYLQGHDSTSVEKALPDTSVWLPDTSTNSLESYYFRHPGFNSYPIVGISYEQAVQFCKWRTDRVNEYYSKIPEEKRPFKKVTYRLPTKKEWESIAEGSFSITQFPYGYDSAFKKWKRRYVHNFNCVYPGESKKSVTSDKYYTSPVGSYFKNSSGTYCMIGNLAEMVAEKGIAKGGSFEHYLEECKIINDQNYTNPERWLGFRCVAVIIK